MFTWICPKCGKEVPPSYSECPNCSAGQTAPNQQTSALEQPAQASAAPSQRPDAPRLATPPPTPSGWQQSMPPWLLTILFTAAFGVVLGTGYWAYQRLQSGPSKPAPQTAAALQAPSFPAADAVKAHPVTALIEITGLRLSEDKRQKAFVQFVVVNHSAAEIADLAANVDLIAVTTDGKKEPVGKFDFKVPSIGPFESKDLKAPVDTKLRVYELPDWQFLRSQFQITSP